MGKPVIGTRPRNLYYGYVLVLAGFTVLLPTYGVLYSFGIILKPIAEDLG
ncbi:MAG: hypothetical protein R6X27_08935 [Candidatus Desulfacyla sp.]